jgi:hypothetical protein
VKAETRRKKQAATDGIGLIIVDFGGEMEGGLRSF